MAVNSSNFSSNSLTGTVRVSGGQATVSLGINKFALQGTQSFVVNLRKDSVTGPVISTSPAVVVQDTSSFVGLTANLNTINEGDIVRFTLTTANAVDGSVVWYSILPVTANVYSDDFTSNTGSFAVFGNQGILDLQAARNMSIVDEAGEVFKLQLRAASPTGNIVYTASNVAIVDTYKTFFANTFFEASNLAYEGANLTFTMNFSNTPLGSIVYYDTVGNVTTDTFVGGNTGSFVYNGSNITLGLRVAATIPQAQLLDFRLRLKQNSATTGNVFAISNQLIAGDSAAAYNSGTGGSIVYASDGYKVHVFTTSDIFTFTRGSSPTYNAVDYYVIGGGGAGGSTYGGGGGAGGAIAREANALLSNTYTIIIGAGGAPVRDQQYPYATARTGGNTVALGYVAYGGGGGGSASNTYPTPPTAILNGAWGGSGGGGGGRTSNPSPYGAGGANVVGQGYPGGPTQSNAYDVSGGGGGALGAGGSTAGFGPGPAPGGAGFPITWMTYTGVGGGLGESNPVGRKFAGGGAGSYGPTATGLAFAATLNTPTTRGISSAASGGGGGGTLGAESFNQTSGGSGVVIVRYLYPFNDVIDVTVSNTFNRVFAPNSNIDLIIRTFNATGNVFYLSTVGNVTYNDIFAGNVKQFTVAANDYTVVSFPIKAGTIPTGEERKFNFVVKNAANTILATSSNSYSILSGAFIDAAGGTIAVTGGYKYHVFTSTSNTNLVISTTASIANNNVMDWMAVGGGGAAGELNYPANPSGYGGGGGGAGGLIWGNATISGGGTYIVRAGAGGGGRAANGSPSIFMFGSPLFKEAYGGGGGGNWTMHYKWNNPGGSGGGASPSSGGYMASAGSAIGSPGPFVAPDGPGPSTGRVPNAAGTQGWPGGQWSGPPAYSYDPSGYGGGGGGGAGSYGGPQSTNPLGIPVGSQTGQGGWGGAVPWLTNPAYGTPGPVAGVRYFAAGGHSQQNAPSSPTGGSPGQFYNHGGSANLGNPQGYTVAYTGSGGTWAATPIMNSNFSYGAGGVVIIRYPYN